MPVLTRFRLAPRPATLLLLFLGLGSEAVYLLAFTLRLPLIPNYDTTLANLGNIMDWSPESLAIFVLGNVAVFVAGFAAFRIARRPLSRWGKALALLFPILFSVTLLFAYPMTSTDMYQYIMQARILTEYHMSPLQVAPAAFPDEPFLNYAAWQDGPAVYGPIFFLLSALPSYVGGDDLLINVIGFKLMGVAFYLGTAALIYLILARVKPELKLAGTVFYAWNPLVLWESAAAAHNDVWMIFFAVLGIYLLLKREIAAAFVALALGTLIKYVVVLFGPLFLVYLLWQRNKPPHLTRSIAAGLALSAVVSFLTLYPSWAGPETLGLLSQRAEMISASIWAIPFYGLWDFFPPEDIPGFIKNVSLAAFGIVYLWMAAKSRQGLPQMLHAGHETIFLYLLIATLWFQPWYLLWLVPLGALLVDRPLAVRDWLFSFTAMMSYAVFYHIQALFPDLTAHDLPLQSIAVAVVFVAPVGWWVWEALGMRSAE